MCYALVVLLCCVDSLCLEVLLCCLTRYAAARWTVRHFIAVVDWRAVMAVIFLVLRLQQGSSIFSHLAITKRSENYYHYYFFI